MNDILKEKLDKLPQSPGVYIMKDSAGSIIYVGKAKVLKNRVRQYFQSSKNHSAKTIALVSKIADFDYIICDSEMEALVLELNLIKENKPKYNILLKDDKHYPYIKITINDEYPKMLYVRRIENDGAKYFGPYPSGYSIKETIDLIKNIFMLPHCNKTFPKDIGKARPCLYYSMGKCMAVCKGDVSKTEYKKLYKEIVHFLEGKDKEVISLLEKEMHEAAEKCEFERAAILRDRLLSVKRLSERQKVISDSKADMDIFSVAIEGTLSSLEVFYIRAGRLIGQDSFNLSGSIYEDESKLLSEFLSTFYARDAFIPPTVLVSSELEDIEVLKEYLSQKSQRKVDLRKPVRGLGRKLVDMARANALKNIENYKTEEVKERETKKSVIELSQLLSLEVIPDRIESYDISHISGADTVGSMVVFKNGKSAKKEYRRFELKGVDKADDTASMSEVIKRRFTHEKRVGDGHFKELPDLILLDGGINQLNAVKKIMQDIGVFIPVFGMVKDDRHRTRGLVSNEGEVYLRPTSSVFHLITEIQDEVHRFAIEYHRRLHNKRSLESELEKINGIGKAKRINLLSHFKSINKIKTAPIDELSKVKGISQKDATKIYEYYHSK